MDAAFLLTGDEKGRMIKLKRSGQAGIPALATCNGEIGTEEIADQDGQNAL